MKVRLLQVWFLVALMCFIVPESGFAAPVTGPKVGTVADMQGEVTATGVDGTVRVLAAGAALYSGDRIRTGKGAAVRFVMADRSMYSVKEDTEMEIKDFKYQESAPEQDSSVFGLVKGGFRFLSGAIGDRNPKKVAYQTPVATIGIRGTEGEVNYEPGSSDDPKRKLRAGAVCVIEDEIELTLRDSKVKLILTKGQTGEVVYDPETRETEMRVICGCAPLLPGFEDITAVTAAGATAFFAGSAVGGGGLFLLEQLGDDDDDGDDDRREVSPSGLN